MTKAQVKTKVKSNSKSSLSAKNGFPEQLRDEALRVLDERQAAEVISYDMRDRSPLFDYIIIATGQSTRQVAAIAGHVVDAFEKFGAKAVRVEGLPQADWVLVDGGDVLVHIFRPEVRAFYNLESIFAASANHSAKK